MSFLETLSAPSPSLVKIFGWPVLHERKQPIAASSRFCSSFSESCRLKSGRERRPFGGEFDPLAFEIDRAGVFGMLDKGPRRRFPAMSGGKFHAVLRRNRQRRET